MQEVFNDGFEEEWKIILNTKGSYTLNRIQAKILQEEIAKGNRGIIAFQTFSISIPYIAEFYRVRRFKKGQRALPARATEKPYKPMSKEQWDKFSKRVYKKFGNPMPGR